MTRWLKLPGVVIVEVGTFHDPHAFTDPQIAVDTLDLQGFHHLPDNSTAFDRHPL